MRKGKGTYAQKQNELILFLNLYSLCFLHFFMVANICTLDVKTPHWSVSTYAITYLELHTSLMLVF